MEPDSQQGTTSLHPFTSDDRTIDLVGQKLGEGGRYVVQHLWRQGGMGALWIAEDTVGKCRVAIKTIRSGRGGSVDRELFAREHMLQDRLGGLAGVPPVIDHGTFRTLAGMEMPFIAMKWLPAAINLREWCRTRPLTDRLAMLARVCDIAANIHERGVLHCDIKPGNILVDQGGEVWLVDYGLAVSLRADERVRAGWEIGWCRATWSYMAPEQCAKECDSYHFTPALDVYSLAVTAYECLTGRLPYDRDPGREAVLEAAREVVHGRRRMRWIEAGLTLHPCVRRAIERSLARAPNDRFQSARELGEALGGTGRCAKRLDLLTGAAVVAAGFAGAFLADPAANTAIVNGWAERVIALVGRDSDQFDHVFLLTFDESTVELDLQALLSLPDEWGFAKGKLRRPVYGRLIDELGARGAKVVLPDAFFRENQDPKATAATGRLLEAIEKFEAGREGVRGTVVLPLELWPREPDQPDLDPLLNPRDRAWGAATANEPLESSLTRVDVANSIKNGPTLPSSALRAVAALVCPEHDPIFTLDANSESVRVGFAGAPERGFSVGLSECITGEEMNRRTVNKGVQDYRTTDLFGLVMIPPPDRAALSGASMEVTTFLKLSEAAARAHIHDRVVVIGVPRPDAQDTVEVPGAGTYYGCELRAAAVDMIADRAKLENSVLTSPAGAGMHAGAWAVAVPLGAIVGRQAAQRRPTRRRRITLAAGFVVGAIAFVAASWILFRLTGMVWNPLATFAGFVFAGCAAAIAPWLACGSKENYS